MDDKPKGIIAETSPARLTLDPGTYWWCRCGRSQNQPFCDSSHRGTGFSPVKIEITEAKQVSLCRCKQTDNAPFCDGTHRQLNKE